MTLFSFGHKSIARKMDPILHNLFWKHPNKYFRKSKDIKLVREYEMERDTEKIRKAITEKLTKSEEASKKRKMPLQLEDKMISLFRKVIPGQVLPEELEQEIHEVEVDEENNKGFNIVEKSGIINSFKN
mmetsp:Transcript_37548/g.49383  ORF Transcript_37548/g.49383 Transcript_37548/m.49383 type:complete len:129 (-) Transcript_37548:772-1158(-)